ncbi:MAG: hypothetical protein AAGN46_05080 [Acidobacteriota bacterium]
MSALSRRAFIGGGTALAASAALPRVAFAGLGTRPPLLIQVVLRGAVDTLSAVVPIAGPERVFYEAARPGSAVAADRLLRLADDVGLHPAGVALHRQFTAGRLAVMPAVGMKAVDTGWFARAWSDLPAAASAPYLGALAVAEREILALDASARDRIALHRRSPSAPTDLGADAFEGDLRAALEALHAGAEGHLGRQTLAGLDISEWLDADPEPRPAGGVRYPAGDLGEGLAHVARAARSDLGLAFAAVEAKGFDGTGSFATEFRNLAESVDAVWRELTASGDAERTVILIQSETGRSIAEDRFGTPAVGGASAAWLLGDRVLGGLIGGWPSLGRPAAAGGLRPRFDHRRILVELLGRHLGHPAPASIFPDLARPRPLGLLR